jgi:hypothetical protein
MNMKRILLTAAITIGTTLFFLQTQAEPMRCSIPVTKYHFRDSAKIVEDGYTIYDVQIDMPELGGNVTQVVRDSIFAFITNTTNKVSAGKTTSDLFQGLDKVFKPKAMEFIEGHRNAVADTEGSGLAFFYNLEFFPEACSPDYITMYLIGYDYLGGAHGIPFEYGVTFLTSNGHILKWNDYTRKPEYLRPTISKHIDSEFFEDSKIRPLPDWCPWLRGDKVVFKYSVYEILPFAAGMPEAEVPYTELAEYLEPQIVNMCSSYTYENDELGEDDFFTIYNQLTDPLEYPVKGEPNIKSFVEAVLGEMGEEEGFFDMRNGYWKQSSEGDGRLSYNAAYWNRTNGSKLFIISYEHTQAVTLDPRTGEVKRGLTHASSPWMYFDVTPDEDSDNYGLSRETGYVAFLYDAKSKTLKPVYDISILGDLPEIEDHRYLELPQHGKDIKAREGNPSKGNCRYRTLHWDGMKFKL